MAPPVPIAISDIARSTLILTTFLPNPMANLEAVTSVTTSSRCRGGAVLDSLNLPADLLTILFGVGVLQVLLTAPAGLAAQMPKDLARLWGLLTRATRAGRPAEERAH